MKPSKNINGTIDYYEGYNEGYYEGYTKALEFYLDTLSKQILPTITIDHNGINCEFKEGFRDFTKEEAEAHEKTLSRIGTVVKKDVFNLLEDE